MNKLLFSVTLMLMLTACQKSNEANLADDTQVVATVGEYAVTAAFVNAYMAAQGIQNPSEQQQAQALEAVIKQVAVAEQAKKNQIQPSLQQQLMLVHGEHRLLVQAAKQKHLADNPVSDADIAAEYERITKELQGDEFHVRHLLYQDESQAISVIDAIKAGLSYLDAEAAYLKENPQGRNVGDIGWVNIMQVPEVFREPLRQMQPASIHPETLVSQYGVHVLYLADKRPLVPPAFEEVKAGIKQTLEQRKLDRFEQLAVVKAKVRTAAE